MHTSTAVDHYLHWHEVTKDPSPHTGRAYRSDLGLWLRYLGSEVETTELTRDQFLSFLQTQREVGRSPRTIMRRASALHGFYSWMVTHELARPGIWSAHDIRSSGRRALPRVAPGEDLKRLHSRLRESLHLSGDIVADIRAQPQTATTLLAVSLILVTGTRVSETAAITSRSIDLADGSIRIHGKGRRDRTVYVAGLWLTNLLRGYMAYRETVQTTHPYLLINRNGSRLTAEAIRWRLRSAAELAGASQRLTPHMLRHAAATQLMEAGVDIRVVQRLLGHASITTTEIYTHVTDTTLRRALVNADVLSQRFLHDN